MLYNKPTRIDHLKVFGYLYSDSNLLKGDKFDKKARKLVFTGYSEVQKGYRLFDLNRKAFL